MRMSYDRLKLLVLGTWSGSVCWCCPHLTPPRCRPRLFHYFYVWLVSHSHSARCGWRGGNGFVICHASWCAAAVLTPLVTHEETMLIVLVPSSSAAYIILVCWCRLRLAPPPNSARCGCMRGKGYVMVPPAALSLYWWCQHPSPYSARSISFHQISYTRPDLALWLAFKMSFCVLYNKINVYWVNEKYVTVVWNECY